MSERCPKSEVGLHSWRFDGDDPYILCVYCGERRDALSGRHHDAWVVVSESEGMAPDIYGPFTRREAEAAHATVPDGYYQKLSPLPRAACPPPESSQE